MVIEQQLVHNERILDKLEAKVDHFAEVAESGPLLSHDAHDSLPTLGRTLAFFRRKIKQTAEVITAISQAAEDNPHFFSFQSANSYLIGLTYRMNNLISHVEDTIRKLENVEDLHDRQKKAQSDKNMEHFTILVGLSAPPIIAEIVCNKLLPHLEFSHAPILYASFALGLGLVLKSEVPKWIRWLQLNWNEHRTAP